MITGTENADKSVNSALTIAEYVSMNLVDWLPKNDTCVRGKGQTEVIIQCIFGGCLIVHEFKQQLVKGKSYSYPSLQVQGLTPASSNSFLYGCMAPDQFCLPKPSYLPKEYINRILSFVDAKKSSKVKKILKSSKCKISDFDIGIDIILKSINKYINSEADIRKIAQVIQSFIGRMHIASISASLGKSYAAITITGSGGHETYGFDLGKATKIDKSTNILESSCMFTNGHTESVTLYQGHHPCIAQHLVIQSDRRFEGDTADYKIAIRGLDSNHIVRFYKYAKEAGLPIVVNCTDGIDRTGILMVSLMMLDEFARNADNNFSIETEANQKIWLIDLIEQLKIARGPYFLRLEKDVIRAVVLGYLLIATYKQLEFERHLKETGDLNNKLLMLLNASDQMELTQLKNALVNIGDAITLNTKEQFYLQQWLLLVEERILLDEQFTLASQEKDTLVAVRSEKLTSHKKQNKRKTVFFDDAPISLFNQLLNQGFELNSVQRQFGKNAFNTAQVTFFCNQTSQNFEHLCLMIQLAPPLECNEIRSRLVEKGYSEKLVTLTGFLLKDKLVNSSNTPTLLSSWSINEKLKILKELKTHFKDHEMIDVIERSMIVTFRPEQVLDAIATAFKHVSKLSYGSFCNKALEHGLILNLKDDNTEFYVHPNAIPYLSKVAEGLAKVSSTGVTVETVELLQRQISVAMQSSSGLNKVLDDLAFQSVLKLDGLTLATNVL